MRREVSRVIQGIPATDGAGVNLNRIIASPALNFHDPFLLLDEFKSNDKSDYIAGFPSHPHRGFETVTYLLHGKFRHKDSKGNEGLLLPGSVQWMTAGRGIIHSEMPEKEEGLMWGYQLWVNLPRDKKMMEPGYQDIPREKIPVVSGDGITVKIISGEYDGNRGPAKTQFPIHYFDVALDKAKIELPAPTEMNACIYVFEGEIKVGDKNLKTGELGILGEGTNFNAEGQSGRFLFLAANKLNEPIARGGPFVMNTKAEIDQAFLDYQNGVLDR